jgi:hypothetical protein
MQQCQNCGDHVTTRFARVFGDNEDEVWACLSCTTGTDILSGGAVAGPASTITESVTAE